MSTEEDLRAEVEALQDTIADLRTKIVDAPKRVKALEDRLMETRGLLTQSASQNERLTATLREAREQIMQFKEEIDKLSAPPSGYGTYLGTNEDGTVDVFTAGRKMRVALSPEIRWEELEVGQEVVLNESFNVILVRKGEMSGEVVILKEVLEGGRVLVTGRTDEERICEMGARVMGLKMRAGDSLLLDIRSGLIIDWVAKSEVEDLLLEEVPDVTYEDVGGLDTQIEAIKDAVELPYLYSDLFSEFELPAPKGILLYGPPGCGKTLIAKAVANSLAKRVQEVKGGNVKAFFINVKGPELLNKYVGETERQIRLIFQRARDKAEEGMPVIIFFDEMESLFRTRGSGVSSDVESTIVPQLLSEIDGVESLRNVIVIGASNREELIDPAIMRAGRLDVKIKVERPDKEAAAKIFSLYLSTNLPLDEQAVKQAGGDPELAVSDMVRVAVREMYREDKDNQFLEVVYEKGDREILYFKDFSSGASIENIVRRAKKLAVKRLIAGGTRGIQDLDLVAAIKQEFKEQADLPNVTNPNDWMAISGKKGEKIVYVRSLLKKDGEVKGGREVERVTPGAYL